MAHVVHQLTELPEVFIEAVIILYRLCLSSPSDRSSLSSEGSSTRRTSLTVWRWCEPTPSGACRAWWSWSVAGGSTSSPPCALVTSLLSGPSTTTTANCSANTERTCPSNSTEDHTQLRTSSLQSVNFTSQIAFFLERKWTSLSTSKAPKCNQHAVAAALCEVVMSVWANALDLWWTMFHMPSAGELLQLVDRHLDLNELEQRLYLWWSYQHWFWRTLTPQRHGGSDCIWPLFFKIMKKSNYLWKQWKQWNLRTYFSKSSSLLLTPPYRIN